MGLWSDVSLTIITICPSPAGFERPAQNLPPRNALECDDWQVDVETQPGVFLQIDSLHATDASAEKMVMEGSALLPELVITLNFDNISTIWLTASNEFLRRRIYTASQYETKSPYEKMLVDKFWERNCLYNDRIMDGVNRLGLVSLDVEDASTADELMSLCLSAFVNHSSQSPNNCTAPKRTSIIG